MPSSSALSHPNSQSKATPTARATPPEPEGLDVWQLRHEQLGASKDDGPQVVVVKAGGGALLPADGARNGLQDAEAGARRAAAG
jgi:hypothetical protein